MFMPLPKLKLEDIKFKHGRIITPAQKKEHHNLKNQILKVSNKFNNYLNNDVANLKKK